MDACAHHLLLGFGVLKLLPFSSTCPTYVIYLCGNVTCGVLLVDLIRYLHQQMPQCDQFGLKVGKAATQVTVGLQPSTFTLPVVVTFQRAPSAPRLPPS